MFRRFRTLSLSALILVFSGAASASVVLHYAFPELVDEADEIVHARVVSQHSQWQDQSIVTVVELEVITCLKGDRQVGERFVILQHGGVVDDLAMAVPGAPTFRVGEETVVFLEEHPTAQAPLVVGLAQGKFSVVLDADSGQRMVTRSVHGMVLVDQNGQVAEPMVRPPEDLPVVELDRPISVQHRLEIEPVWVRFDDFLVEIERNVSATGDN